MTRPRPGGDRMYAVTGNGAAIGMLCCLAEFAAGPGLDGFVAWMDQARMAEGLTGPGCSREQVRAELAQVCAMFGRKP